MWALLKGYVERFQRGVATTWSGTNNHISFLVFFCLLISAAMGPCKTQGVDNIIPLTGETGRLFSPLYPQTYPTNMTCTWKITVPEGHLVKLKITSFHLGTICHGSTLQMRDGQSESNALLKSYCRHPSLWSIERSFFSSGRHLWVQFKSPTHAFKHGSLPYGFSFLFEAVNQCKDVFQSSRNFLKLCWQTVNYIQAGRTQHILQNYIQSYRNVVLIVQDEVRSMSTSVWG